MMAGLTGLPSIRPAVSRAAGLIVSGILACIALVSGCASLPEIGKPQPNPEAVRFEGSRGPLSAAQSRAILERLKAKSGESSLLDRHIALEQSLVDSPLVVDNEVSLLKDGPATYRAMFAAIGKARKNINLETYIFEDDEVGQKFADLLIAKQKAGVQVAIIYDSIGAINAPREFFKRLEQSGIRTVEFNPINPLMGKNKSAPDHRDHRKLLIVDGRTAFLGGINISRVYSAGSAPSSGSAAKMEKKDANKVPWRDTHVQIEGPVVAQYQKLFLETWERQSDKALEGEDYFPQLQSVGKEIVRAVGSNAEEPYSQIYVTLISAINSAEKS
ncbi:MAG: phospholipase D-like domain-containing protein, partial [Betaproteobacteria bacterium]